MNDWPPLPDAWRRDRATERVYRAAVISAAIDAAKHARDAPRGPLADDPSEQRLHDALTEVIKGAVDRARDGAKFVETAASAIGVVYAAVLGLVFAADGDALPLRGVYAAAFLGLAIVSAAYYLAFLMPNSPIGRVPYTEVPPEDLWRRTEWFSEWISASVYSRAPALRAAVVSLALGVLFLPAAFLPDRFAATSPSMTAQAGPTPSPIAWPSPPQIGPPEVAAVLYDAQLRHFETGLHEESGSPDTEDGVSTDAVAAVLFLLGVAAVVIVFGEFGSAARAGRRQRGRNEVPRDAI